MGIIRPTKAQLAQAKCEASNMGRLKGSFTKGRGNVYGMLGEILFHAKYGGRRVGHKDPRADVILKGGLRVDVKSQCANRGLEPSSAMRIYGAWDSAEWLRLKCDVYFFVKIHRSKTSACFLGWAYAEDFMDTAEFVPKGDVNPIDGRRAPADEFTIPSSDLRSLGNF